MMFNDHTQQAGRVFGLDLMRTVAILLVVFWHSFQLMADHWSDDLLLWAIDGVDLFFVLSGFLIGGILLRMSEADEFPWWRRLLDFWQRRWLRTLPNYFLFLLVNIALVYYGLAPGILNVNTLAFFVFLQNFMIPVDLFFWESWSLAVEEWFYLLFPILLFFLVGRVRRAAPIRVLFGVRRAAPIRVLFATMIMILVPTILRFSAIDTIGTPFMLDVWMRKIVLYRLDTIGFGVLMACAAHYLPAVWQRRAPELFVLPPCGVATAGTGTFRLGHFGLGDSGPASWPQCVGLYGYLVLYVERRFHCLDAALARELEERGKLGKPDTLHQRDLLCSLSRPYAGPLIGLAAHRWSLTSLDHGALCRLLGTLYRTGHLGASVVGTAFHGPEARPYQADLDVACVRPERLVLLLEELVEHVPPFRICRIRAVLSFTTEDIVDQAFQDP